MAPDTDSSSRAQRLSRRRRRRRYGAIVVVGVVAAGAVAVLLRSSDDGDGPAISVVGDTAATSSTVASTSTVVTRSQTSATAPSSSPPPETTANTGSDVGVTQAAPPGGALVPESSGGPVTLAFGGDTHFESFLRTQLDADPSGMLAPIAPTLAAADLAIVNLETSIGERGEPVQKEYTFRAPPTALAALRDAGVDVVSLANNHGLDYGAVGVEDALAASQEQGLAVIGIGRDADEAYAPFLTTINGRRIAVIAATQVLDSAFISSWTATDTQGGVASAKEVDRLISAVERARAEADTLVVFLHWGVSLESCPSANQQTLAAQLADAGADVVVGGHAHLPQGAGFLGETFVAYGLGNFIWYAQPGPSAESGVLRVRIDGREVEGYEWLPARIRDGVPHLYEGADAQRALAAWEELRDCTGLSETPT